MAAKEKSLPLAIGLNFLVPGLGYIYMGKWIVGIFAFVLLFLIYIVAFFFIFHAWLVINLIMTIDMLILSNKNKLAVAEQSTKKCPFCAERIQLEAKICRFCGTKFEAEQNPESQTIQVVRQASDLNNEQTKQTKSISDTASVAISSFLILAILAIIILYNRNSGDRIDLSNELNNTSRNESSSRNINNAKSSLTPISAISIDSISSVINLERISEIPIAPAINISEGNGWLEDCAAKKTKNAQASAAESKGWLVRDAISAGSYTFVLVYSQAEAVHKDGCWIKDGALLVFRNGILGAIITVKDGYDYLTSIGAIQIQNENGLVNLRLHPGVSGAPPYADMSLSEKNITIKDIPEIKSICPQKIKTPNVYRHTDDDARMALTNYGWREEKLGPDESNFDGMFCDTNNHCFISFTHQSGAVLDIDMTSSGNWVIGDFAGDVVNMTYKCDSNAEEKIY